MARAIYTPPPSQEHLSLWGFTQADVVAEVWPETVLPMRLFNAMGTQWRTSQFGPTGLDYSVLPFVAESVGIKPKQLKTLLPDLQLMESAGLSVMREVQERALKK